MFMEERHREILQQIAEQGRISIGDIQEKFDISLDSARRDLRILEKGGLLKRTHGGAIPAMPVGLMPPRKRDFDAMEIDPHYDAIAKEAASMIQSGQMIYMTSGSFGYLMLKYLPQDFPFTLVLNSPSLADKLKYRDNLTIYMTGGKMRMNGGTAIVDSMATAFVNNLHFDLAFLTGAGLTAEFGLSNGTDETASFQRAVIENTRKKVLLMPYSKIGANAFVKVSDAANFDTVITDWEAVEDELLKLEEQGLEVVVTEK